MIENVNVILGKKVRLRRLTLGLNQTTLAKALGISFQQIQKYENGKNGLSAERLVQLSRFLGVPVSYFFEELENPSLYKPQSVQDTPPHGLNDKETQAMLNAFSGISSQPLRISLVKLAAVLRQ